jgi:cell wall-associated NlpC family hydrolase
MGASRWQGIQRTDYSGQGQYPNYADCSAFATWVLWNALKVRFGVKDIVNGADWLAGYTGTLLTHGVLVAKGRAGKLDLSKLVVGDLIIYGHGWPGTHVAIYVGGGMVVSHGSEGGPYYVRYDYRSDIMEARRYI